MTNILSASNLHTLTKLKELDLSGNKFKDYTPIISLVNQLPKLEVLLLDNNPCWPEYNAELRIKFLAGLTQMDHLGASLKFLNGFEITIAERVL